MLGSFKKTFRDGNKFVVPVPKAIIKSMADKLPEGFGYQEIKAGLCIITFPQDVTIEGNVSINSASKDVLQQCHTYEDYYRYATNLQQKLFIGPNDDGYLYIGGKPFTLEQMFVAPYETIQIVNGGVFVDVPKFDKTIDVVISIEQDKYLFSMKRVAYDSLDYCKFVNVNYPMITMSLIGKQKAKTAEDISISVSVDISKAKSVEEVCEGIRIYNGFAKRKAKMFGTMITKKSFAESAFDEEVVGFWNSLKTLESVLGINFNIATNTIDASDVELIKKLMCSFIQKKAFIPREKISSISGDITDETSDKMFGDIGKPLVFQYEQDIEAHLLGVCFKFVSLSFLYDVKIEKIVEDEGAHRFTAYFSSVEGKDYYQVSQFFLTESDLTEFLNSESFSVAEFAKADKISGLNYVY